MKDANDYSVFQCWGFDRNQKAYLLDQVRGKWAYPDLLKTACDFWQKHSKKDQYGYKKPVHRMYIENKASGQSLLQQYQLFREFKINCHPWPPEGTPLRDKVARVRECLATIASGRVVLPTAKVAPWVDDFIAECGAFNETNSQLHDDQVDAMTMALMIWRVLGGRSDSTKD